MLHIKLSTGFEVENNGNNLALVIGLLKNGAIVVFTNVMSLVRCWGPIDSKDVIKIDLGQWLSLMDEGEWEYYLKDHASETTAEVRKKLGSGELTLVPTQSFSL